MKIHMISLGCAKNLVDSEHILGILGKNGNSISVLPEDSDAVIINTCGFIGPALQETEAEIRRISSIISERTKLYVYGCAVNRFKEDLRTRHPRVNGWYHLEEQNRLFRALHVKAPHGSVRLPTTQGYAYLKIADGCSNNCAYCTIPSIRGPYRSISFKKVVDEARQLGDLGYREMILIAQDTTRYGMDRYNRSRLADLIKTISRIPTIRWIRIMYAHPRSLTQDVIQEIAHNDKVCAYIDLPVQHISTRILHRMNRGVTRSRLMALLQQLQEIKDISIRTTVIAGFPGEKDIEFEELFNFLQQGIFSYIGVFPYYREHGTRAAGFRQIPDDVVQARYHALLGLQQELMARDNVRRVNRVYDVLVDQVNSRAVGHTEFAAPEVDAEVVLDTTQVTAGQFYRTRITRTEAHTLFGTVIKRHAA